MTTPRSAPARILHYCHDTYGLGHLRRALAIAHRLEAARPGLAQLVVTGSPLATELPLPPGADTLKLPCVVKTGDERYDARSLATSFEGVRALRSALLHEAVRHFRPDIVLVDHAPGGVKGEAVRALVAARRDQPATRIVLGLRDIVDTPGRTRAAWAAGGIDALLERVYDRILVYGQRDLFDPAQHYGLSPAVAEKLRFVGYLRRGAEPIPAALADLVAPGAAPYVLATAGGGGDGHAVLDAFLRAAAAWPGGAPFRSVVVTGPFMADAERAALHALAASVPGARIVDFVAGLSGVVAHAAAVVSMAGYNTTCEILSFRRPAVLVPRTRPRQEQLIRAAALARRGVARMVTPEALTADSLGAALARVLADGQPPSAIDLGGLDRAAGALIALLERPAARRRPLTTAFHPGRRQPAWSIQE